MDQYGLDKFSLVNFAVGLIWQQTGLSFLSLAIVYTIFKIVIIISTVPIPQPKSVLHLYGYLLL